jgi:L-fuconolactonase
MTRTARMTPTTRIDAHHHVWDLSVRPQVWMDTPAPSDPPDAPGTWANPLRRTFTADDLKPHLEKNSIDRTIVVQTVSSLDETRELLEAADSAGFIAGVVGWADLTDPALPETLAELRAHPTGSHPAESRPFASRPTDSHPVGSRLVGVRHQVHDEPDPGWLLRPDVLRGLRTVADAGLAYDLLIRAPQLDAALGAVRQVPHGRFVVDHIAKPEIAGGTGGDNGRWYAGIAELAAEPNVTCKLSGMVTEADWSAWTVDDLLPYARHVLEAFGPNRVMFGSDWPVCTLAATYDEVVAAAADLLARCGFAVGSAESESVFGLVAQRVYLTAA